MSVRVIYMTACEQRPDGDGHQWEYGTTKCIHCGLTGRETTRQVTLPGSVVNGVYTTETRSDGAAV